MASSIIGCRDNREAQVAAPAVTGVVDAVDRRPMAMPSAPLSPHASPPPAVDPNPKPMGRPSSACHEDLASFCRVVTCTTFEATKREAERNASASTRTQDESGLETRARTGTCGAFRFVTQHDAFSGWTQYFDSAGKLVSATRWSDTNSFCGGTAFRAEFGDVPRCP